LRVETYLNEATRRAYAQVGRPQAALPEASVREKSLPEKSLG
jgi:hypothetical protein